MTSPSTDRRFGLDSSVAIKAPCRVATTANITLSGEQTVDGVAVVTGDRVLVKNQTSGVNNGIYIVDTGSWSRSPDFDDSRDVVTGTIIPIVSGTANHDLYFKVTNTGSIIPGTTSLTFVSGLISSASGIAFTPAGTIAATDVQSAIVEVAVESARAGANSDITSLSANRHGADIASASTINLTTATGDDVNVTGTTTINAITLAQGVQRVVKFTGTLTLTNSASLVLPGGANIITANGDYAVFLGRASSVVECIFYTPLLGSRRVAQVVSTITGAMATGTTVIPADNTIPQNTEGDQYMSLAITPKSASSTLEITVSWNGANSAANYLVAGLFQDTTANALSVAWTYQTTAGSAVLISFKYLMTSGTTSATTFKVRVGGISAGTTTFNGNGGTAFFGGTFASSIVIKEYLS